MEFCRLYRLSLSIFLIIIAFGVIGGCNNSNNVDAIKRVIVIDPDDDSCVPVDSLKFQDCAEDCEVNSLGCANDILRHIESGGFISRRVLRLCRLRPAHRPACSAAPAISSAQRAWNTRHLDAVPQRGTHSGAH